MDLLLRSSQCLQIFNRLLHILPVTLGMMQQYANDEFCYLTLLIETVSVSKGNVSVSNE